jgi:hypothetical protein
MMGERQGFLHVKILGMQVMRLLLSEPVLGDGVGRDKEGRWRCEALLDGRKQVLKIQNSI